LRREVGPFRLSEDVDAETRQRNTGSVEQLVGDTVDPSCPQNTENKRADIRLRKLNTQDAPLVRRASGANNCSIKLEALKRKSCVSSIKLPRKTVSPGELSSFQRVMKLASLITEASKRSTVEVVQEPLSLRQLSSSDQQLVTCVFSHV
jgi:hypothetical protein